MQDIVPVFGGGWLARQLHRIVMRLLKTIVDGKEANLFRDIHSCLVSVHPDA